MSSGSGQNCNCSAGCCDVSNRRDFLRIVGFSAAAIAGAMPVMAGPFEATDLTKVAPPDRNWIGDGSSRCLPVGRGPSIAGLTCRRSACPSGASAQVRSIWAATAVSGTGTFSTSSSPPNPRARIMPTHQSLTFRSNRASPFAFARKRRTWFARWTTPDFPTFLSRANIRSGSSNIAIRDVRSRCLWKRFRHLFRYRRTIRTCRRLFCNSR